MSHSPSVLFAKCLVCQTSRLPCASEVPALHFYLFVGLPQRVLSLVSIESTHDLPYL